MNVERLSRKEVAFGDTGRWNMRRSRSTWTGASRWRSTRARCARRWSRTRTRGTKKYNAFLHKIGTLGKLHNDTKNNSGTSCTSSSARQRPLVWTRTSARYVGDRFQQPTSMATISPPARARARSITILRPALTKIVNIGPAVILNWTIMWKGRTWKSRYQKIMCAPSVETLITKWQFWISTSRLFTWTRNPTNVRDAINPLQGSRKWKTTWKYTLEKPNIIVPFARNSSTMGILGGTTRRLVLGRKRRPAHWQKW